MANLLLKKDGICRTCLKEAVNCKSLLTKMENDDRTVCEVLSCITSFDIIISEKYPKQICNECFIMIRKTEEFKKRCIQSETLLKNEFLNCSVFVDDFVKQDLIPNSNLSPSFNNEDTLSSVTDTLKIDVLNVIKKERDDFLQEDIEDLSNTNLIDKIELTETTPLICISKTISSDYGREEKFNHEESTTKCENLFDVCKREIACSELSKTGSNAQNVCNFEQNFTNDCNISNKYEINQVDSTCSDYNSSTTKIFNEDIAVIKQISNENESRSLANKRKPLKPDAIDESSTISCPHCTWVLPDVKAFEKHLEKHRCAKKKEYQCSMCSRKFLSKQLLRKHIISHLDKNDQKFVCTTCKREFKHQAHLENHIENAHTKIKGFKCDTCTKSFSNQESLEFHKKQHTNTRKYQCNVCSKTFAVHSVLNEHLRTHTGEKPFLCSICGRGFTQKTNLAQHMRRHQGLKPYKCGNCDRSFVSKGELDAHTRKHTGKHPFVCDECGNGFTTSSSLTKHRRIHTGEKRYACDLCSMRFTALGTLKNHRRTHTGEKPYQCMLCEKAFIQRQDLVGHIRCHTGERPFTCTSCGQGFRKSSALKVHLRSHGNDMLVM
ncbi:unnamed protein product [Danaus chrysippus]|uniref:(African queen) hypothetical protein n=1 Tax=Danaus chrysippus TaxID=151541 RepID=A0A8J2QXR5_9NEOP|nr:unnamed protein product [Danaus chrysippus]